VALGSSLPVAGFADFPWPPPSDWQKFERLCHALWQRIWRDPNAQMHGGPGQAQQGVDVYGTPQGESRLHGIQCKRRDPLLQRVLTEEEVRIEVENAKAFQPPLAELIIATCAPSDAKLQAHARRITEDHAADGLFRVHVFGWSEIVARMGQYPEVVVEIYPVRPITDLSRHPKQNSAASKLPAEDAPDQWKLIRNWVGWVGLVALICWGIFWVHISKLQGIERLVAQVSERTLPGAVPGKFNIAIAHLVGDDDKRTNEELIRESLKEEFPSVVTLSFDRLIAPDEANSEQSEREGQERARDFLATSGADVLIWGKILQHDGKSLPKLNWSTARAVVQLRSAGRYQMTEDLRLPSIFWQELTNVLGLLVATSETEFSSQRGRYTADKLEPFIERVRALVGDGKAGQWNSSTRAQVQFILADALSTYGEQSGKEQPLQEAVSVYREALKQRAREKVPRDWAMTQNNLGNALRTLGERSSDTAQLTDAVTAYRDALKERTRERVPLDWAMTQNNLGNALATLGERSSDTAQLTDAVTAYHEALKEYTREKVPLAWAMTQNNLGNALATLEERSSDTAQLAEAVTAYREALKEYTREKVPLKWATTQNNLGAVLETLGKRSSDPAQLIDAVTAYREVLKEDTREKVPLEWATTEINLGGALARLGERSSDAALLNEAEKAFKGALPVFRDQKGDYYVQLTERNLQGVQKSIEQLKTTQSARVQ
jgi:tetratricopeptide (TPR) repeat protein